MRGWSFPLGRWFGVHIRVHMLFVLLLVICVVSTNIPGLPLWRGLMLCAAIFLGVSIREIARLITASYFGVQMRSILLLPIGGLVSYANPDSADRAQSPRAQTIIAIAGPAANLLFTGIFLALIVGASPLVPVFARPWVTPVALMRSLVWLNFGLFAVHLLPAYPLDMGRLMRAYYLRKQDAAQATKSASQLSQVIGATAMVLGLILLAVPNTSLTAELSPWLLMGGFFIFIGAQLEDQGVMVQSVVDTVRMKDVMLTDFRTLSPSDTLSDALKKAIHSLQDDFPVARGLNLIGVVSKQSIVQALRQEGDGYVQSIMSRGFQLAQPEDSLGLVIRRIDSGRMPLVPVAEHGRIVGIVSLQNLRSSMMLLAEYRRLQREQ
ncbi:MULTISPECIES: CBS domain-containing protein [Acidobacterium]|uniref:Zinc metalloprotease n=1 Tax=Acidobacterium capsulatum (strain ATCC 51196 / DSM 11244 / BCRC 80197 / JCM 7670 / NBRC 15755 / NCIMB 13165 / 161) TaxID=240015 RepID=C1F3W5_ACIC5|nr:MULTISPECIES: CBS domain-containing protein [Acidobacterium]ACO31439.1 peptidase, M50 family [Acidobacterium capsulatum ATCC 51196]HCT60513.1 CBS domain-containing protein [Acidobacterium sp.]